MAVAQTAETPPTGRKLRVDERVSPLELFFDLVFVFALTQVTALMADNATWEGLAEGMLVLAALWWAWGAYAWLTNYINTDEGRERLLMFGAMAAMLVAALAVPGAFGDDALLFACAYALVRWLHVFIFAEANDDVDTARGDPAAEPHRHPGPGPADPGRLRGRRRARRALGGGAGDRLRRAVRVRRPRLSRVARPLRGALRPDRDHRPRASRSWPSAWVRRASASRRRWSRPPCSAWSCRPHSGGRTSTWSRWWPSAASRRRAATPCPAWPGTRTATSTCR